MMDHDDAASAPLEVEPTGESAGHCDCCGRDSRTVWGFVRRGDRAIAAYFVQWTVDHLQDNGANFDFIIGSWGDDTGPADRAGVSLLYRIKDDGPGEFMVIDAHGRRAADSKLVGSVLTRGEVIGTPPASQVFELVDAVWDQDDRFY